MYHTCLTTGLSNNLGGIGQYFPYLDGTTSDSSEEVLSIPLLPELFILNPSSLLHCCIMVLFPMG